MGVFMGRGGSNFSSGYFYVIFGGNRVDADDYEYFRFSTNNPYSGSASNAMTFPRSVHLFLFPATTKPNIAGLTIFTVNRILTL